MFRKLIACAGLLALQVGAANANVYLMTVTEGLTSGNGFNTLPGPLPFIGSIASATFSYTGTLNFDNAAEQNSGSTGDLNSTFGFSSSNISHYSGSGTVTLGSTTVAIYATVSSFLASSGSASSYQYASFYAIDLGTLAAGTILTITHDDGASVYQGSNPLGSTVSGPTAQTTDQVKIATAGDTMLYYSCQNGTPSILEVSVPEPASIVLLGAGLAGLRLIRRRRRTA